MRHETTIISEAVTAGAGQRAGDYAVVRRAIQYLSEGWAEQPGLDRLANHLELSPEHCQRVFKRWCGLSPKEFVQAITIDHARRMLDGSASVLEAAYEVGLSGGSRLHDLFVTHEAMTPGTYKRRGEGLAMAYGFHATPFGEALATVTERGLTSLSFVDEDKNHTRYNLLESLRRRWPGAELTEAVDRTEPAIAAIFGDAGDTPRAIRLVLIGTDFEVRVWQKLLRVPMGRAVSYGDIAGALGAPAASRAVGSAVGRNPISFVVPCHRVFRGDGGLGGYHWGVTRKKAIIGWEAGRLAHSNA